MCGNERERERRERIRTLINRQHAVGSGGEIGSVAIKTLFSFCFF